MPGAVGYGWLNFGWAVGAFVSVAYAARATRPAGGAACGGVVHERAGDLLVLHGDLAFPVAVSDAVLLHGIGTGWGGIAITTDIMQRVPKRFMGRVQNPFYFAGTGLQIFTAVLVGYVAHHIGLARGIAIIGALYAIAAIAVMIPTGRRGAGAGRSGGGRLIGSFWADRGAKCEILRLRFASWRETSLRMTTLRRGLVG